MTSTPPKTHEKRAGSRMKTGKTMRLSPRALEILRAGVIDEEGRLRLSGPPESREMHKEITRALEALGWVWNRQGRLFEPRPHPVAALQIALATGEVQL